MRHKNKQKAVPAASGQSTDRERFWLMLTAGACLGAAASWLYFRNGTCSLISCLLGAAAAALVERKTSAGRRKEALLEGFKDMLEALASSFSSGSNTYHAFQDVHDELRSLHGERAEIVLEAGRIRRGLEEGVRLESLLQDFAERSGLEDIRSFSEVLSVCQRRGGDVRAAVADARTVLCQKIEMEASMRELLTSGKMELNILIVLPFAVLLFFGGNDGFALASNAPFMLVVKIASLILFALAYALGRRIMNIRI